MQCRNEDCGPTLQCQDSSPLHQERRHQYESISAKKKRIKNKKIRFEIMWYARGGGGGGRERVGSRLTFRKLRFFFLHL